MTTLNDLVDLVKYNSDIQTNDATNTTEEKGQDLVEVVC